MMNVINLQLLILDFDNSLSPGGTLGDLNRPLFYPEATKAVFETARQNGIPIYIMSGAAKRSEIKSAFITNDIDLDDDSILTKEVTYEDGSAVPESRIFNRREKSKAQKSIELCKEHDITDYSKVAIIEDDYKAIMQAYEAGFKVIYVPIDPDDNSSTAKPITDAYLRVLNQASGEQLTTVSDAAHTEAKKGYANADLQKLDNTYKAALSKKAGKNIRPLVTLETKDDLITILNSEANRIEGGYGFAIATGGVFNRLSGNTQKARQLRALAAAISKVEETDLNTLIDMKFNKQQLQRKGAILPLRYVNETISIREIATHHRYGFLDWILGRNTNSTRTQQALKLGMSTGR